jgi:hypothetical protein
MYVVYSQRDNVIQSEQAHLLQNNVEKVKKRMDEMQAKVDADIQNNDSTSGHWKSELELAKRNYVISENQVARTIKATKLNKALKILEDWLPIVFACAAIATVFKDILAI